MKKWIYKENNDDWRGNEPDPQWDIYEELTPQQIREILAEDWGDDEDFEEVCKEPVEFGVDVYEMEGVIAVAYSEETAQEICDAHNARVENE